MACWSCGYKDYILEQCPYCKAMQSNNPVLARREADELRKRLDLYETGSAFARVWNALRRIGVRGVLAQEE
jgi:hypothetical protein